MTINANFPAIRPSLNLDFANSRALDPRITFARASSAMYYDDMGKYRQAATNEARFDHDPVTGECKGLLIEESRTNLLKYSEQFDNALWGKGGGMSVVPDAAVSPDGLSTAEKLIPPAGGTFVNGIYAGQNVTKSAVAMQYTVSCYAKAGEYNKIRVFACGANTSTARAYCDFVLSTGIAYTPNQGTAGFSDCTASIVPAGNGWYRCSITVTSDTHTAISAYFYAADTGVATGDGASGIYIWGAQLEAGDFPTSYIPTTSAQATRAADVAQMTGANFSSWYRQDEGSFVASVIRGNLTNYGYLFAVDAGSSAESIRVFFYSDGSARFSINDDNTTAASISSGALPLGSHQVACAYQENNSAATWNGTNAKVDSMCSIPTPNALRIGIAGGSIYYLNGHIARLTYYPKRLPNTLLQELSR